MDSIGRPPLARPWSYMGRLGIMLDSIRFEHSIFALPFAYLGMILAAGGWPTLSQFIWITVAMVAARTVAMSANAAHRPGDGRGEPSHSHACAAPKAPPPVRHARHAARQSRDLLPCRIHAEHSCGSLLAPVAGHHCHHIFLCQAIPMDWPLLAGVRRRQSRRLAAGSA